MASTTSIEEGSAFWPRFDDRGLIPVFVVDGKTGEGLMAAWMNHAALEKTLANSPDNIRDTSDAEREFVEDILSRIQDNDPPNILKFQNIQKTFMVPYVIYCDFESFISCDTETHTPSGFSMLVVSCNREVETREAYTYSGEDVMTKFYDRLCEIDNEINDILNVNVPMHPMTDDEIQQFDEAVVCFLCQKPFDKKTRHHNHVTGKFIAPCCVKCNLQLKPKKFKPRGWNKKVLSEETDSYMEEIPGEQVPISSVEKDEDEKEEKLRFFIPVIFHNGKNYDLHHILKFLQNNSLTDVRKFRVIATNSEKFISVQIGNLRILDSCQFLPGSLESLVENLKRDGEEKFVHTRRHFEDPAKRALIMRKGVYPYEYMSSEDKFLDIQLSSINQFHSKLSDSECSIEDYEHAQAVWKAFKIKDMQEYHDLYLKTDVLLLADVFESFRRFSLNNYGLDPAHYYTSPGLSFDACMKMTGAKIELLTDPDSLLFFESAMRGGVSMITH